MSVQSSEAANDLPPSPRGRKPQTLTERGDTLAAFSSQLVALRRNACLLITFPPFASIPAFNTTLDILIAHKEPRRCNFQKPAQDEEFDQQRSY